MYPLNPASLDNSCITNKKLLNKTIKNQKNFSSNTLSEINTNEDQNINNIDKKDIKSDNSDNNNNKLPKITQVNDVVKSIFTQNNEQLNSDTIFDINTILDIKKRNATATSATPASATAIATTTDINNNSRQSIDKSTNYSSIENIKPSNYLNNEFSKISNFSNNTTIDDSLYKNKNNELLDKLNYTIYLLEEQRAQKSNYVTEEIILYIFLGIFIIFVLDKFNKPGKYTR